MSPTGYRCGAIGEYTGGNPKEAGIAWKVLNYEYEELGNDHLLDEVAAFMHIPSTSWAAVIKAFRDKYGDIGGIWLSRNRKDAREYKEYGTPEPVKYDSSLVVSDLGGDGIYVLNSAGQSSEDLDLGEMVNGEFQWFGKDIKGRSLTRYDITHGKRPIRHSPLANSGLGGTR
jgi:hypothetical protein